MTEDIRIGIVGANPDTGWAFTAHVPAIGRVDGARITAVSTTRETTARRAAELTGAHHWFTQADALASSDDVDLVVIAVKVPAHRELIQMAVSAGKHVYSEWPLGATTSEAEYLAELVSAANVRGFIGLQARADRVLNEARRIIEEGMLGDLLALSVRSSRAKGPIIAPTNAYTLDAASGAGNIEVHGGHLLDLLSYLLPEMSISSGYSDLVRTEYRNSQSGDVITSTAPDVFTVQLRLSPTGIGTATVWDGDPAARTEILIQGLKGQLRLWTQDTDEPRMRQPQMAPFHGQLTSETSTRELAPDIDSIPLAARNVAGLYTRIVNDLHVGSTTAPTFADAVRAHRLIDNTRTPAA